MWGCLSKVAIPPPKAVKIGPKTGDCVFIEYAHNSSAYRFLVHRSTVNDIHNNTIMESRNAQFFEDVFPCESISLENPVKRTRDTSVPESSNHQDDEEVEELRRSKQARTEKSFGLDFMSYLMERDPHTYMEAMSSPDASLWKEAIKNEIDSILQNHTWELVDLPQGSKALGCKWIFKKKMKADGTIDKYKARLVIKGYR